MWLISKSKHKNVRIYHIELGLVYWVPKRENTAHPRANTQEHQNTAQPKAQNARTREHGTHKVQNARTQNATQNARTPSGAEGIDPFTNVILMKEAEVSILSS